MSIRKKMVGPTWRLLIMLLVMGDAIWRLFEGTRPFDWLMLVLDFLVLLIITIEFVRDARERWCTRKYERGLEEKLSSLTVEERKGLEDILKGGQPQLLIADSLTRKIYGLVIRMPHGLDVAPDRRTFVARWLSRR